MCIPVRVEKYLDFLLIILFFIFLIKILFRWIVLLAKCTQYDWCFKKRFKNVVIFLGA